MSFLQPILHLRQIAPQRLAFYPPTRMRPIGQTLASLAIFAALLGSTTSVAASTTTFQLPAVQIGPICSVFDSACTVVAPLGTSSVNEIGDSSNPISFDFGPPLNRACYPLSGSVVLDLGGGDTLAFASHSATDSICVSQNVDDQQVGIPPLGPWPLVMTVSVDPATSTGKYAGATGTGTLNGTWIPTTSCQDQFGQPLASCGFSGEELTFTLTDVAVQDLTLLPPTCDPDCTTPPGPGQTPELDSLTLFGSALASLGAYLGLRRSASKRS